MDIWALYAEYDEDRENLSVDQRRAMAICDLRQEVNSGGFDNYLRGWGGDTALEALELLPRVLGQQWFEVLAEAVHLLGPTYPATSDDRAVVLDDAAEADDVLGLLDDRYFDLEGSGDADAALGRLADDLAPWPGQLK